MLTIFCGPISKLKQFYTHNRQKCHIKKKSSQNLITSPSSTHVEDTTNYLLQIEHTEHLRRGLLGGIESNTRPLRSHISYITLFQFLPDGIKKNKKDSFSETDAIVDTQNHYKENDNLLQSSNYNFKNYEDNKLPEEISSLKQTVEKLDKEKAELELNLKQLENRNSVTYNALKSELESSNSNNIKLCKEIEYLQLQIEKLGNEYKMQIESLEEQIKVEKDRCKGYISEMCFMKLKANEENLKQKIKTIKKEYVELKVQISTLEKVNIEQASKLKYTVDFSAEEISRLQKQCSELGSRSEELEAELLKVEKSWHSDKTQLEEYCLKSKSLEMQIQEYTDRNKKTVEKLRENIIEIEKEKINLKCNAMFQSKEIEMLDDKVVQLSSISIELKKQLHVFKCNESILKDKLIAKENELENIYNDKNSFKQEIYKLRAEIEMVNNENRQITSFLNEMKYKLKAYKDDKLQAIKLLDEKTEAVEQLITQNSNLKDKVTSLSKEKIILQERVNELLQNLCKCEAKNKDIKNKFDVTNLKKKYSNLKQENTQKQIDPALRNNSLYIAEIGNGDLNKYFRKCLKYGIKCLDVHELAMLHKSICEATQCLSHQNLSEPLNSAYCHNSNSSGQLEHQLEDLHKSLHLLKNCSKTEIERMTRELEEIRLENCMLRFDCNNQNLILNTYRKSTEKLKNIVSHSHCNCQNQYQQEGDHRPEQDKFGNQMKITVSKNLEWKK